MLDKSDLQAIAELMDLKLEPIKEQLAEVRDVATRAALIQEGVQQIWKQAQQLMNTANAHRINSPERC